MDTPIKRHNKDVSIFYYIVALLATWVKYVLYVYLCVCIRYIIFFYYPRPTAVVTVTAAVIGTIADATLFVCVSCRRSSSEFRTFLFIYLFIRTSLARFAPSDWHITRDPRIYIRKQNAQRSFWMFKLTSRFEKRQIKTNYSDEKEKNKYKQKAKIRISQWSHLKFARNRRMNVSIVLKNINTSSISLETFSLYEMCYTVKRRF